MVVTTTNSFSAIPAGLPTGLGFLTEVDTLDVGLSHDPERRSQFIANCISIVPKSIIHMGKLRTLNLSGNDISELPPEFGQLTSLTQLNMGRSGVIVFRGFMSVCRHDVIPFD